MSHMGNPQLFLLRGGGCRRWFRLVHLEDWPIFARRRNWGGRGRVRAEIPDMSVREISTFFVKRAFKLAVDNVVVLDRIIESGFFEGLCESIWLGPPRAVPLGG